jgi:hypothetical protein
MSAVSGEMVGPERGVWALGGDCRVGCGGPLIRSGDGDLLGQTAAGAAGVDLQSEGHAGAPPPVEQVFGVIIAAGSRWQHHDFTERGQ